MYDVTLIPGDGIGPEVAAAARQVIDATGVKISWHVEEAGAAQIEKTGTPLPERVIQSIRDTGLALKGPVTTPIGCGFRSVNVALRKALDLYVNVSDEEKTEAVKYMLAALGDDGNAVNSKYGLLAFMMNLDLLPVNL